MGPAPPPLRTFLPSAYFRHNLLWLNQEQPGKLAPPWVSTDVALTCKFPGKHTACKVLEHNLPHR